MRVPGDPDRTRSRGRGSCRATRSSCRTRGCRRCSPATPPATRRAGRSSGTSTTARTGRLGRVRRVLPRARARRASPDARRSSTSRRHAEPVPLPGGGRLPARAAARPDLAPARLLRARRRTRRGELPDELRARRRLAGLPLLGSLGSADVGLMQRLVDVLAATPHRVHRVEGTAGGRDRARATNMWGAEFLPQPLRSCRWSTS